MDYILEKIWKRFEAIIYIDHEVLPKQDKYVQDDLLKFGPFLTDNFNFIHDSGENFKADADDEFHKWVDDEEEYL